jgi:large subunit ribosomal protein L9
LTAAVEGGTMKVILKQNIEKLGRKGDVVNVAPGYGRNYLLPRKLALEVTPTNLKMIEIERQSLKKKLEQERQSFLGTIQKLNQVTLSFTRRAGDKDVIFGSVSAGDIKEALEGLGFEVDKKKILLDEPIKRLGNFTVPVKVYHEDKAEVKIVVVKEEAGGEETENAGPGAGEEAPGTD